MTFRFLLTMVVVLTTVGAGSCAAAIWGGFLPMLLAAVSRWQSGSECTPLSKQSIPTRGYNRKETQTHPKAFRRK